MQYDSYEQKVAKIANFLKLLFKHKLKILISASFVMIATVALLATRGTIVSADECPESIVYGESLNYSANAFLSGTHCEYQAASGGEWSTEFPVVPGEYNVRVVARATFGYKYGPVESFVLLPKEITVTVAEKSIVYGDNFTATSSGLISGDTISCDSFAFDYDSNAYLSYDGSAVDLGDYVAEPDPEGITITNSDGLDVTSSYIITTEQVRVSIRRRPITIAALSAEKVYDGEPLTVDGYEIRKGSLASGDTENVTVIGQRTNAGATNSKINCFITNENGENVTHFYNVTTTVGLIKVTPREITVSTADYNAVYDGTIHSCDEYSITEGSLAQGEHIIVTDLLQTKDCIMTNNVLECQVFDANENNVSSNYSIKYVYGTFGLSRREIGYESASGEFTYDGEYHSVPEVTITGEYGLADGDWVEVNAVEVFDAGEVENFCMITIYNPQGEIVTSNYEITSTVFGTLKINKRALNITTPTDSKIYDGNEFCNFELLVDGLADIDYISYGDYTSVSDVGEYENLVEFFIRNSVHGTNSINNYDINITYGTLTVLPRQIGFTTATHAFVYNGQDQWDATLVISGDGLVSGHETEILSMKVVRNVKDGLIDNIVQVAIICDGTDVSSNYDISYEYGKISIVPRDVYVWMGDNEKYYDGIDFSCDEFTSDNLVDGHLIIVTDSSSALNAGVYPNELLDYDIVDEHGESVKDNYNMNAIAGVLNIKKRPVIVSTASAEKVYDATPLRAHGWIVCEDSAFDLVEGHLLDAPGTFGSITDSGSAENYYYDGQVLIYDASLTDMTDNYDITVRLGTLIVHRRPITTESDSYSAVYDGKEHNINGIGLSISSEYNLCPGHFFNPEDKIYKNVVYDVANDVSFGISDMYGNDVTDNYLITENHGTVTISHKPLSVYTESYSGVYDGKEHNFNNITIVAGELCEGHELIPYDSIYKNVTDGEVINATEFEIYDEYGYSVTDNYDVAIEYGTVSITKKEISVSTESYYNTYDGKEHNLNGIVITLGDLCEGHELIAYDSVYKNVTDGEVFNSTEFVILDEFGENVIDNYDITVEYGTVNIIKREISVYTESYNDAYDGKEHNLNVITIMNGDLCEGHEIIPDDSVYKNVVYGETNIVDFVIYDALGEDVTSNYQIDTLYGSVTIFPREIEICTESYNEVYDGKEHNLNNITVTYGALCENHLFVTTDSVYKDVIFDAINAIVPDGFSFYIVDEYGYDVTSNYDISEVYGIVNIYYREITVTSESYDAVYDGKEHNLNNMTVTVGTLCDGHKISAPDSIFKDVVENAINYFEQVWILDSEGNDVTANYIVQYEFGTVTISKKVINLSTESKSWTYDGNTHSHPKYKFDSGYSVIGGHNIKVTSYPEIWYVGSVENILEFVIIDEKFENVTHNYDIIITSVGILKITSPTADSDPDPEDPGEENYGDMGSGNISGGSGSGGSGSGGSGSGGSGSGGEGSGGEGSGGEGSGGEGSGGEGSGGEGSGGEGSGGEGSGGEGSGGEGSGGEGSGGEGSGSPSKTPIPGFGDVKEEISEEIYFVITSDTTGKVYLKFISFGSYDGRNAWSEAPEYTALDYSGQPVYHLPTNALSASGCALSNLHIIPTGGYFMLPYYAEMGDYGVSYFDACLGQYKTDGYDVKFYSYDGYNVPCVSSTYEEIYRSFVYENYLEMDSLTREYIELLLTEKGISSSDSDAIDKVIEYISTFIANKEFYDFGIDSGDNTIIAFLSGQRKDMISYSAAAATMMFRSLGIPARYCTGFAKDVVAGNETEIVADDYYAWVEIYINGFGWVNIDVGAKESKPTPPVRDDDYNIGAPPVSDDSSDGEENKTVLFVINSDKTGLVYLKEISYGDYTGKGFLAADAYEELLLECLSAYYLGSISAQNGGLAPSKITINSLLGIYVLPYYASDRDADVQLSDVYVTGDASDIYAVYYYDTLIGAILPEGAAEFERRYAEFVRDHYLTIDNETNGYLQGIIAEQGFDKNDPEIIEKVAEFIQNCATYDLKYDRSLDASENIVIAFIETYKSGICQHYATAATMLYRALGIPARFTVGFVGYAEKDTDVEITAMQAHAWVEVYIEGIGWMQVEVTGTGGDSPIGPGGSGGSGGSDGEGSGGEGSGGEGSGGEGSGDENPPIDEKPNHGITEITVSPIKQSKVYDSYPLYAQDKIIENENIRILLSYGYTYEVTIEGTQTVPGTGVSKITSFIIYDPLGTDVTGEFEITLEDGILEVSMGIVEIYIYEKSLVYSGEINGYLSYEYIVRNIPDGISLEIDEIKISLTDIGSVNSETVNNKLSEYLSYRILTNDNNEDVTSNFTVRVVDYVDGDAYDILTVTRRELIVTTASSAKQDDEKPLKNSMYYISYGKLGDGHQIHLDVIGEIIGVGTGLNTVNRESLKITDAYGNDVTSNYKVEYKLGTLTIL